MLSNVSQASIAFTRQAPHFDDEDQRNPVLQRMRSQVYAHLETFLKPKSNILELNAGTGIDAVYLTERGHRVHATELAAGMISELRKKSVTNPLLSIQQLSYTQLDEVEGGKFDYVFSNFGGLNCIQNLREVTRHLPALLNDGAYVTFVVMPAICPWEILGVLKNGRKALRRFQRGGTLAHLEGTYFKTYYHSLKDIEGAFDSRYTRLKSEGLASLSPSPHTNNFTLKYPRLTTLLNTLDDYLRQRFPFNRWGDHLITTFQFNP